MKTGYERLVNGEGAVDGGEDVVQTGDGESPAGRTVDLSSATLSDHARTEMERRGISGAEIAAVLASPEQVERVHPGWIIAQSRLPLGAPQQIYLVRVIVDVDRKPPVVVTVYRTSKIAKYWRWP